MMDENSCFRSRPIIYASYPGIVRFECLSKLGILITS